MTRFLGDAEFKRGRGPDKRPRRRRMARNLAIAGAGVVGTGVAARYGVKRGGRAIGNAIETASREASRRASKGAVAGAAMGAQQGARETVSTAARQVPNAVKRVVKTPANTRKAFQKELTRQDVDRSSASYRVGRRLGKARKWVKRTTGFSRG